MRRLLLSSLSISAILASALLAGLPNRLMAQESRSSTSEVRIPLQDGRLSLLALSRALLDAYDLNGNGLDFPDQQINVTGFEGQLLLFTIGQLSMNSAQLRKVDGGKTLRITIDHERATATRREIKVSMGKWLGHLIGKDLLRREYQLQMPADLAAATPVVLFIHGLDASAEVWDDMRQGTRACRHGHLQLSQR